MRNVVPRTPATAFSVSIWNFCSPWITEVTFAQSLPKNNLALNFRLAAPPKCASASWTFALGPRRSAEIGCCPERGDLAHGDMDVIARGDVLGPTGGDLLDHVLTERARCLLDRFLPAGDIVELRGALRRLRGGEDVPVVGVHRAAGDRRGAGEPARSQVRHLAAHRGDGLAEENQFRARQRLQLARLGRRDLAGDAAHLYR